MKIGLCLLCRNEADIIVQWMEYHMRQGYDIIHVADNGSSDGTWEYLLSLRPRVSLSQIADMSFKQSDWVYAIDDSLRKNGCDWIVNLDADEFIIGDVRAACEIADKNSIEQLYPHGTFMRCTPEDPNIEDPIRRMTWHDTWSVKYSNDKAILHSAGLTGVCQGNHCGYWNHTAIESAAKNLYLYHYEQRSAAQLIKKYGGHHSADKLSHMGEGWRALNQLWIDGGDQALIQYWNTHCIYDTKNLEQDMTSTWS